MRRKRSPEVLFDSIGSGGWNSERIAYSIKISFLFLCKIYSDLLPSDINKWSGGLDVKKYCFTFFLPSVRVGELKKGFYGPLVDDLLRISNSIHKLQKKKLYLMMAWSINWKIMKFDIIENVKFQEIETEIEKVTRRYSREAPRKKSFSNNIKSSRQKSIWHSNNVPTLRTLNKCKDKAGDVFVPTWRANPTN